MRMSIETILTSVFVRALLSLSVEAQQCSQESRFSGQLIRVNNK